MVRRKIQIRAPKRLKPVLRRLARRVLRAEGSKKGVNIVLGDDETLADLNKRFKGREEATDVLAFDFAEEDFLGEVYVSLDRARKQAAEYDVSLENEVRRLVIHGLLHLLGYSHEDMEHLMKRYLE
ncbi:rRNA maturation RNase YbeY [candidate division WOR-3 bacterium]|nr:rRNA maturation RNase YbeY [candidate division WOR-3 bacterium]